MPFCREIRALESASLGFLEVFDKSGLPRLGESRSGEIVHFLCSSCAVFKKADGKIGRFQRSGTPRSGPGYRDLSFCFSLSIYGFYPRPAVEARRLGRIGKEEERMGKKGKKSLPKNV